MKSLGLLLITFIITALLFWTFWDYVAFWGGIAFVLVPLLGLWGFFVLETTV